eukprot:4963200-Amphidinium_carterae.1
MTLDGTKASALAPLEARRIDAIAMQDGVTREHRHLQMSHGMTLSHCKQCTQHGALLEDIENKPKNSPKTNAETTALPTFV